jgi:hypothetical protein
MSGRSWVWRGIVELTMVFLGVMGAFLVDEWRERHEERAQEILYLERLVVDLRQDSSTIDAGWTPALERKLGAIAAIAPYARGRTRMVGDTLAFLRNVALAGAGGFTAWAFDTPTFDDLMTTGNLRLIRNADLRARIVAHYRGVEVEQARITARLPGYPNAVHAIFPAEERDAITMESVRDFGADRALVRIRTEVFVDLLNREYNSAVFQRTVVPRLRASTVETLGAVEEELVRLGGPTPTQE